MTLKTTKERIEQLLVAAANTRFDDCLLTLSREEVTNLCHDADMAGELEKELETGRKAWKVLQQKNADLRAKLDGAYEKIIDDLHKRVGLCSHCGKTDCAGKASGSKLPGVIATAEILSSLQSVFRALKEQDKP